MSLINQTIPNSCDDPRLDAERRSHCRLCEAQTTREGCLATTAQHWNFMTGVDASADNESCTWVFKDPQGRLTREVEFSLGLNMPFMFASRVAHDLSQVGGTEICQVQRKYEVLNPITDGYTTAYFVVYGNGQTPAGEDIPGGLRPDASCTIAMHLGQRSCTLLFTPSEKTQWSISSRDIWTQNPKVVAQLNTSRNEDCLIDPAIKCVGANPPFRYRVTITDIPCAPKQVHTQEVRCVGTMPLAVKGHMLYPKALQLTYRHTNYFLQGLSTASWTIKTANNVALLSMVMPMEAAMAICPPWGNKLVCDFDAAKSYAVPGTVCFGPACSGSIKKAAADDLVLVVTYPWYQTKEEVVPAETPPTIADIELRGWP
ncbi:hypothetical protein COHA_003785 [Chlorella ohadii]|uniref:Uncharacterized protein n=1 Tax=Chlorella ohadii TaxID=2649997 RepID=A0AAD5DUC6_9CHLO|nr:hypothetical protein COHA_003785 [Chlorella ohadii]